MAKIVAWDTDEITLAPGVSVLAGANGGKYPSGNSLVVRGSAESAIIDPSLTVVERGGAPVKIDAVINSHGHEDHICGNGLFADARVHVHHDDLPGIHSLDGLMDIYGFTGDTRQTFANEIVEQFHYTARPDATGFADGHIFDLGGTTVEAVHLPGHTRGHAGFRISGGVFFLSDIDLSSFGPYYGDLWSDLDDFDRSLEQIRDEDAAYYVTFHHKGVIEGRAAFLELLDKFHAVIPRRHQAMLDYMTEPRTIADMVEHRFVYRAHVENTFLNAVEQRCAELHVARMLARGEAHEVAPGQYQRS